MAYACGRGSSIRKSRSASLFAEVARLSRGVVQQSDLLRRAEDERHSLDLQGKADSAARASLVAQSQELQKKMAAGGGGASSELQKQLLETQGRLNRLESEGKIAELERKIDLLSNGRPQSA